MKKEIFKRFEGGFENFSTKRFIEIDITPSVYFIIDNQWNETFETEEEIYPAFTQYMFGIQWLSWQLWFSISFKRKSK